MSRSSIGFFLTVVCAAGGPALGDVSIRLEPVASGLSQPLFATHAGDGSGRLFIVEKGGRVKILRDGALLGTPFLDIAGRVTNISEMGLLGLAFHPGFAENGRFFVNYATEEGGPRRTVVAEFEVDPSNPDRANENGERILLSYEQPAQNHNGGMLAFGPDGFLYIGTGDGGGGGDPSGHGQDRSTPHGNILRIDVDRGDPYAIPPENPFMGEAGVVEEIWAYGLRNPWRFSFDRFTGQLYVGDVGQNAWEEINLVSRGDNLGWRIMEGNQCYPPGTACDPTGLTPPVLDYPHPLGRSVTGGYVYRGDRETSLWGSYVYGDFITGRVWALAPGPGQSWTNRLLIETGRSISSFGEDEDGELYLVDFGGEVLQMRFLSLARFAQFADGASEAGRIVSRIAVVNPSGRPLDGVLRVRFRDGSNRPVEIAGHLGDEFPLLIPPHSSVKLETTGLSEPLFVGWAEIEADGPFSATILYSFGAGVGEVAAEAGLAPAETARRFLSFVSRNVPAGIDTGVAVANPGANRITVDLALESEGLVVAVAAFDLESGEQRAEFLGERFPDLDPLFEGTLSVFATGDMAATLLRTLGGAPLSSLPMGVAGAEE
jgi:glucose/arabinose dehydrogenase